MKNLDRNFLLADGCVVCRIQFSLIEFALLLLYGKCKKEKNHYLLTVGYIILSYKIHCKKL